MSPDRESILALSSDTGFRPETLEKVIRLGELLADVTRHPLLSRVLVLKGGTAINLFFGEPRRLSVDLDFNYVGRLDREEMRAERPEVERAMEGLANGRRYRIQRSSEEAGGRKWFLAYRNVGGTQDRIEIDVNFLFRLSLSAPAMRSMWQPPGLDRPSASVVGLEELASGKLLAFLDRVAPRDVYDAIQLPGLMAETWSSERFRKIFVALSSILPHPVHSYRRERVGRLTNQVLDAELLPMLSRTQSISAAELVENAWSAVQSLLELQDDEREFVDLVQRGELKPELLFADDEDLASKVRQHLAILWKIQNARIRPS
jgi:predicted nucleotidyltransferase component of viral defense system